MYDMSMTQPKKLQSVYSYIRSAFFPRWDKKKEWKLKEVWDLPSEGRCETVQKLIYIKPQSESDQDSLHLLLIHEICHAIAPNHGERWQARMLKAADRARQLGMSSLSALICQESDIYFLDKKKPASEVYQQIRQMVQQAPQASFGSIIRYLAMENGLYRNEMVKKYSQCRKIYEQALKSHLMKQSPN
jgi:hypothetical protein